MALFRSLSVIGPGLIGSSVLRRAREKGAIADRLIAMDMDPAVRERVAALGLADEVTGDLAAAAQADCVMLCVPVGAVEPVARAVLPHMKPGAILTDVASVRGKLGPMIAPLLPPGVAYIPGHPMAGTEFSGPDAGFSTLFENRWVLLVPPEGAPESAIRTIRALWDLCGARTRMLTDEAHDRICAVVSHLPHLLAFATCEMSADQPEEILEGVRDYAAPSFRSFTRIAASDPVMWRDIFLANRDFLLDSFERFAAEARDLARAIREEDGDAIMRRIERARTMRRSLR